ncbi:HD domain-containing protein [candidate division KSB1 bacterium]|nr:HD domain-containing protein [candidate division KSB1 bacterium]
MKARIQKQIEFILEIDKLKHILRQSYLLQNLRRENSAEHSWQLALMAMVLAEYSDESIDLLHVIRMALVHDIVEIDAGDTYCYGDQSDKSQKEQAAAERLYGLLPDDQAKELHALWMEFETRETPEARFAAALDRLMPLLLNYHTQGQSWLEHGVRKDQVLERNCHIAEGSKELWDYAETLIQDAVKKGFLLE